MTVTLVNSIPHFLSPDEHRTLVGSTPASFSDIPPVLRYKEENISVTMNPLLEDFPVQDCSHGTLYIIESVLVFMSTTGRGFQIEYPSITLHAVSRTEAGPSIYCQLDENAGDDPQNMQNDDTIGIREFFVFPQSESALEPIFEALSLCASLHPDKVLSEEDIDDAFLSADESGFEAFTGDEGQELSEAGRVALTHLESIICDRHVTDDYAQKVRINTDSL